jgi:hypothetical protein
MLEHASEQVGRPGGVGFAGGGPCDLGIWKVPLVIGGRLTAGGVGTIVGDTRANSPAGLYSFGVCDRRIVEAGAAAAARSVAARVAGEPSPSSRMR